MDTQPTNSETVESLPQQEPQKKVSPLIVVRAIGLLIICFAPLFTFFLVLFSYIFSLIYENKPPETYLVITMILAMSFLPLLALGGLFILASSGTEKIEDSDLLTRTKKRFRFIVTTGIVAICMLSFLYVGANFEQNRRDIEELRAIGITGPEPEVFCVIKFDKNEYQPGETVYLAWETRGAEFVEFYHNSGWGRDIFVPDFSTSTQFATSGVIKLTLRENIYPHPDGYKGLQSIAPIKAVGIISQGPQKGEPKYAQRCVEVGSRAAVATPPLK